MKKEKSERKVLFAHDGPLFKDAAGNYYGIHITNKIKERYLYMGGKMTALMRTKQIPQENISKYSPINPDNFGVIEIRDDFKKMTRFLFDKKEVEKIVEQAVLDHDIIVARIPSMLGSIAITYANKHKKPLMCEFVACSWDALWNHSLKGKLVAPYFFIRQKLRMKNEVPYVVYVTKEFLQQRYPTKGISTNCSNVELKEVKEESLIARKEKINSYTQGEVLTLCTVAAIDVLYKGQADVIEALHKLKKQGVNFKYKLIGQGNPAYLQSKIDKYNLNDNVEIVGPLKHDEVFEFLKKIDIYIQPSKQEGLPRAVIEAMSMACPVLGARTGGIPELIDNKYIFEKGDVNKIAELLGMLKKDELLQMAETNFNTSKDYVSHVLAERRFSFYDRFLEDHGLNNN